MVIDMRKLVSCIQGIFLILILVGFSANVSALDNVASEPIDYSLLPTGDLASQPTLLPTTTVPTPTISPSLSGPIETATIPEGTTTNPSPTIPVPDQTTPEPTVEPGVTPDGIYTPEPAQPEMTPSPAPSVIQPEIPACPECQETSEGAVMAAATNTSASSEPVSDELSEIRYAIRAGQKTWTAKENEISALSDEEFRNMLGVLPASSSSTPLPDSKGVQIPYGPVLLPDSLDWRNNSGDYTTPVKSQGYCGSCWAFGAIGAFEARTEIAHKNPNLNPDYSEQDLVSCAGCGGCSGAYMNCPQDWLLYHGAVSESCFPYVAWDAPCNSNCNPHYKISGWRLITPNTEQAIKEALTRGPIIATFEVYNDFRYYSAGVYEHTTGAFEGYHAVTMVGWGEDSGGTYWICKNSWGNWGDSGYFKIRSGNCGINGELYELYVEMPIPVADFTGVPTIGIRPLTVQFTDLSSGSPTSWDWSFGDGTSELNAPESRSYLFQSREIHRHPVRKLYVWTQHNPEDPTISLVTPPPQFLDGWSLPETPHHLRVNLRGSSPITRSGSKSTTPPAPTPVRTCISGQT